MLRRKINFLLIIVRFFEQDFPKYHKDYFDELKKYIRENNDYDTIELHLLNLSSKYLYSSQKRFEFCQHFIRYFNDFLS